MWGRGTVTTFPALTWCCQGSKLESWLQSWDHESVSQSVCFCAFSLTVLSNPTQLGTDDADTDHWEPC